MTPTGFVIVVVLLVIFTAAFLHDKKKANGKREEIDAKFAGKHVAEFPNGYLADNILFIKDWAAGYFMIDLTKVKSIGLTVMKTITRPTIMSFYDENGKPVGDSSKLKYINGKTVDMILDAIGQHCDWIE